MFYAYLLLNKRGVLSKIWMAAHWEKKLTKAHIYECNLESAIQSIITPKVTIALRTSGHLLIGVVRIYHRKAKYLLADCNEALVKMSMAFCPGTLDLSDNQEASYKSITLPEEFPEFDVQLPDVNVIDVVDYFTLNQSRTEDITLQEDYSQDLTLCRGFGEQLDAFRGDSYFDGSFEMSSSSFQLNRSSATLTAEGRDPFTQDCFGDEGLMTDFFDDKPLTDGLNQDILDMGNEVLLPPVSAAEEMRLGETPVPAEPEEMHPIIYSAPLLSGEQDSLVLEPVEVSGTEHPRGMSLGGTGITRLTGYKADSPCSSAALQMRRKKKNRNPIVDKMKELASDYIRQQLLDFSDTVTSVDIAPSTRKLMDWKTTGGVEWLLCHPCQLTISADLQLLFTRCLRKHRSVQEDQTESQAEIEITRLEKDVTDLPRLEDPSYLQESRLTDASSCAEETPQIHDDESGDPPCSDFLGPAPDRLPEELLETVEDAQDSEEHRWNKRTQEMLRNLRKLNQTGRTSFSLLKLCKNNSRREASAKFYSFLALKKQSALELRQNAPYSDIIASPGSGFYSS
ncbi:double-strand-break repair protein rad21-like protein 1 [Spea bombifrons]|uniref:double-strand-break repair protein rad21-like protein 1 n=1 Tax=Spea bombifrons TaxID=233779 RepID=UPI0023493646|nr:double-strand-break repair protein rad21-like protein 1 [Spea bombifrons]